MCIRDSSYRMHPVDIIEGMTFLDKKKLTVQESLKRVMKTGGFPESFDYPADSERLRNHRFDLVLQEDLRDLSKVNSIKGMSYLIELLRERVGSTINYQNLAEDLSVSAPTIKSWIELLERLYVIYIVKPYSKGLARSIKKDSKIYFYDTASALNGDGAILENTVASSLLKFIDFEEDTKGVKGSLHFYRDKEKREIDFVIVQNNRIKYLIEIKNSDDNLHRPLLYLKEKLKLPEGHAFQLVLNISRNQEVNGVKICDLAKWFEQNIKFKNK